MKLLAEYEYTTPSGQLRIQKRRFEPKSFRMYSWVRDSGELRAVPRIHDTRIEFSLGALYRLPEVVAGIETGRPIALAEGERDADALTTLGVVATTGWQGASEFLIAQARRLEHAERIAIVCDNDRPGWAFGWTRYRVLREVGVPAQRIRILAPPRAFKDAADAVEAGVSWGAMVRLRRRTVERIASEYAAERAASRARRGTSDWMRSR